MQLLEATLILALASAFVILFISRFEVREGMSIRQWVMTYAPKLVSEMFGCDFCLSWWTCLFLGVVASCVSGDVLFLLSAPLSTPITRYLL